MPTNQSWYLRRRPVGEVSEGDLELVTEDMSSLSLSDDDGSEEEPSLGLSDEKLRSLLLDTPEAARHLIAWHLVEG